MKIDLQAGKKSQLIDYQLVIILGLAHAISDCVAGFLIGKLSLSADIKEIGFLIALYNLLAFAGQMPAGLLLDKFKNYHSACLLALMLSFSGLLIYSLSAIWAIIFIGIGSAFFHVSGGALTYTYEKKMNFSAGIFAGPGVFGLILGGWLAHLYFSAEFYLMFALLLILVGLWVSKPRDLRLFSGEKFKPSKDEQLEVHDLLMLILLLAIAMRSAIWNIFQLLYTNNYEWLFYLGIAAMAGKIVGGYLTDRLGLRNYTMGALLIVIPLLIWGERHLYLLIPGIFLLQSLTPAAMVMMYQAMPYLPATAAGASLGMGIAIGGMVFYMGLSIDILLMFSPILAIFTFLLYNLALIKIPKLE